MRAKQCIPESRERRKNKGNKKSVMRSWSTHMRSIRKVVLNDKKVYTINDAQGTVK